MYLGHYDPEAREVSFKATPDTIVSMRELSKLLSHKISNQLAYLINYLFIIKKTDRVMESEEIRDIIERMEQGIIKTDQLLKGTTDALGEPTEGHDAHLADIREIYTGAWDRFQYQGHTIQIRRHMDMSQCPKLDSNLALALNEIFINSLEAEATVVDLTVIHLNNQYEILVVDNGIGMEPVNLEKIFTPFNSTKKDRLGLGLFRTAASISNLGGSVHIKSSKGEGVKIRITIPTTVQ